MVYERDPKTGRKCKKGQRGRWYYYFTIDGIRYGSVIPAATNKKEAQVAEAKARAEIFEDTYAPRKKLGRAIFSDFVWIEEKQTSEYLDWAKENKKSWRFDKTYAHVIAGYFKGKQFREITQKMIEQYRDHRLAQDTYRGDKRNRNSVRREMALLSRIFRLAVDRKYCAVNPVKGVTWPAKQENRRTRILSDEEEEIILQHMTGKYERLRAPFLTALYVGCRRQEMFSLTWDDIDLDLEQIHFRAEITKTKKARNAVIIEPALSELRALKDHGVSDPTIFGIGIHWATHLLRELLGDLTSKELLKPGVTGWHICRHTYISRGARAGIPPAYLREQVGHEDLDMTFYYSHAGRDDLLREARKLEKRPNNSPNASAGFQAADQASK